MKIKKKSVDRPMYLYYALKQKNHRQCQMHNPEIKKIKRKNNKNIFSIIAIFDSNDSWLKNKKIIFKMRNKKIKRFWILGLNKKIKKRKSHANNITSGIKDNQQKIENKIPKIRNTDKMKFK